MPAKLAQVRPYRFAKESRWSCQRLLQARPQQGGEARGWVGGQPRPLPKLDHAAIFAGVDRHPEDPANLFRIAIAFEQRAVDFFSQEGERAPAGSVESQLYKELAAEERAYARALQPEPRDG